ncbi:hypothetical protein DFQ28_011431, partial [Apophysomyces sp. BC1034]
MTSNSNSAAAGGKLSDLGLTDQLDMGKPAKQPRVKGNMKPASSSRAAVLAASTSASLSFDNLGGFAQFAGSAARGIPLSKTGSSTPPDGTGDIASATANLDPELIVILKKLSKRDAVTKLKALDELESYLKVHTDALYSVLPSWVSMYGKLTIEVDRRVRLATNNVHLLITTGTKKKLAPHLKEFIGAWMVTMFDPYKDVAKAAKSSFESVFAKEKRMGAIFFCQKEILDYVTDMLLHKSPETLSDARYVNKEDMATKFSRVISSCLYCVSHLIETIPIEEREKCSAEYNLLLDDPTLWKFATHTSPAIRKAIFNLVKALLLHWPDALGSRLEEICPSFFASIFAEKDTVAHEDMWDALLLMTKKFPESWVIISKKKSALPKLCAFLRAGLNGSAKISYPSMLALLANLPPELRNLPTFYKDVFNSFWEGLSNDAIDKSNYCVFLNAYMECAVYFAITHSKSANADDEKAHVSYLIDNVVWKGMRNYFVKGRNANVSEKVDINCFAILAKHLTVLESIENLQDYMPSLWANMDAVLTQTVIDCASPGGEAVAMDEFCHKLGNFICAIKQELEVAIKDQSHLAHRRAADLSRRLLLASVSSSIVYKDKSYGLLFLAGQVLSSYATSLLQTEADVKITKEIIMATKMLPDKTLAKSLWDSAIEKLSVVQTNAPDGFRSAEGLLLFLEQVISEMPNIDYGSPKLDGLIHKYLIETLGDDNSAEMSGLLRRVFERIISLSLTLHLSRETLSKNIYDEVFSKIRATLSEFSRYQSMAFSTSSGEEIPQSVIYGAVSALKILQETLDDKEHTSSLIRGSSLNQISGQVFDLMFVKQTTLHTSSQEFAGGYMETVSHLASSIWGMIVQSIQESDEKTISEFRHTMLTQLRKSICDVGFGASPSDSVRRAKKLLSSIYPTKGADYHDAVTSLLGTKEEWSALSAPFTQYTAEHLSLAVVDRYAALVQAPLVDEDELSPVTYDMYGLSAYGRSVLFAAEYIRDEGIQDFFFESPGVSHRDQLMFQLMVTSVEYQYGLEIPHLCRVWDSKAVESSHGIRAFVVQTETLFAEWFDKLVLMMPRESPRKAWFRQLCDSIQKRQEVSSDQRLLSFIARLLDFHAGEKESTFLDASVAKILQRTCECLVLKLEWEVSDVECWLNIVKAENTEVNLPTKVAIISSFKNALGQSPQFSTLQSHLVSKLSAVAGLQEFENENSQAWDLLVLLNATALKFGSIAIPPQRLMHLLLAIKKWFQNGSSEDGLPSLRTQVTVQLAQLFINLSESVQNVSGGQWEFFLEQAYEWAAFSDASVPAEIPIIFYALQLFSTLHKIAKEGNEVLHDVLDDESPKFYEKMLSLFAHGAQGPISKPRQIYQELLSDLLGHVSDKTLFKTDLFSEIYALLYVHNETVQKRAYILLKKYVKQRVEDLSVQLEFTESSEQASDVAISTEIAYSLQNAPDVSSWHSMHFEEQALHDILGYLLSWLLMFGHCDDITFRLKQEYTAQLKDTEVVSKMLPVLFKILGVGAGQEAHPFDLAPWGIDEYEVDGFESASEISYLLLASHLYYQCLKHFPSIVRTWWVDCKNRQLTIAVEGYTEKHFSGLLISNEMELINRADVKSQLEENGENEFTVKPLKAANEVTATYRVDDQNMQIAIKLPTNYPLRQIDVEGIQKVGVNEKQWRGWMFAVAAVIGSQNGNIADALTVFKRNVNLHFDGVADCTICYSIISVQDRSIPNKQCRTCKNKFHSSCLYK